MATGQLGGVIHYLRHIAAPRDGGERTDGQLLEGFLVGRDETAFAALVRRHGPMVLGVCRRLLNHMQDAEDAFQATFLVLVKRAASVVPRDRVGNWLYGVAYRTALEAKAAAAKRRVKERAMRPKVVIEQDGWAELQPVLDYELNQLPDKYRVPIVLCDLEGKTRKEAARQLGWPEGTVSGRLARARVLLAKRLTRRGLALSGGALGLVMSQGAASAAVPATLVMTTVRAATGIAAGQAAAGGVVSAPVAALMEGVMKAMLLSKLKNVMAVLAFLGLLGLGVGSAAYQSVAAEPPKTAERLALNNPAPAPAEAAKSEEKPDLPKNFPPQQVLAQVDKEGQFIVKRLILVYEPITEAGPVPGQTITTYLERSSLIATSYKKDEVTAYDTKGKKIDLKELVKWLEKEAPVLASNDGKPVDPLHLRLIKDDTVILVLPMRIQPPLAAPPPAVAPRNIPLPALPAVPGAGGPAVPPRAGPGLLPAAPVIAPLGPGKAPGDQDQVFSFWIGFFG